MIKKAKKNITLNFEKSSDNLNTNLFNCFNCGFHGNVISKVWVIGNDEEFIVQLLTIHPESGLKINHIDTKKIDMDGEMMEDLICGICGNPGQIEPVPNDILKAYGYKIKSIKKISNKKEKKLSPIMKKLRTMIK